MACSHLATARASSPAAVAVRSPAHSPAAAFARPQSTPRFATAGLSVKGNRATFPLVDAAAAAPEADLDSRPAVEKQPIIVIDNYDSFTYNLCQFACNAHAICDPELRPLGTELYPVISIINHSCVPNAVLIFDGRAAHVSALQPIGKDEEVSISYIETAAVTKKRHNDLKQYFFTCTCPRCVKGSEEDALLEGFRCKNQACDGFLLPDSDWLPIRRKILIEWLWRNS